MSNWTVNKIQGNTRAFNKRKDQEPEKEYPQLASLQEFTNPPDQKDEITNLPQSNSTKASSSNTEVENEFNEEQIKQLAQPDYSEFTDTQDCTNDYAEPSQVKKKNCLFGTSSTKSKKSRPRKAETSIFSNILFWGSVISIFGLFSVK
jgi:hypothetical protein